MNASCEVTVIGQRATRLADALADTAAAADAPGAAGRLRRAPDEDGEQSP
jgi:hypothetical protein